MDKLSEAQETILRRIDNGEVLRTDADGKGYRFDKGDSPNPASVEKLLELKLVRPATTFTITDEGKVELNR